MVKDLKMKSQVKLSRRVAMKLSKIQAMRSHNLKPKWTSFKGSTFSLLRYTQISLQALLKMKTLSMFNNLRILREIFLFEILNKNLSWKELVKNLLWNAN